MNNVEDRLRDALGEQAAHSPISPDAWERTMARTRRRARRPVQYLLPLVAAAAVTAIILTASIVTGQITSGQITSGQRASGTTPAAGKTSSPVKTVGPDLNLYPDDNISFVPPRSAVLRLHYAPPGNTAQYYPSGSERGTVWFDFYLGYRSTVYYWWTNVSPGLQFCMSSWHIYSVQPGPGHLQAAGNQASECEPAPSLTPGQQVRVLSGTDPGLPGGWREEGGAFVADVMREGIAARQVASVTAVLPDGRSYPGAVGTARGLGENAWSVMYPADGAVRLVFRDAAGNVVAQLTKPANPVVPGQGTATRPARGGVSVAGGEMTAYLIDGHVGFWPANQQAPVVISTYPADSGPALGAVVAQYGVKNTGPLPGQKNVAQYGFYGYARADVSRVVLRFETHTGRFTTITVSMGGVWPGTGVRLWSVPTPPPGYSAVIGTATAYDATGHVIGKVKIGMWAPA